MGVYVVPKGALPQSSDVNQVLQGLLGQLDLGALTLFEPIAAPSTALTAAVNTTSGNLTGTYGYVVTFVTGVVEDNGTLHITGETGAGPVSNSVSPSSQQVNLTAIPTGPTGTIARRIYRNQASGSASTGPFYLVTTLAGNTITTFTDNVADGSLGNAVPTTNTTGTYWVLADQAQPAATQGALTNVNGQLWIGTGSQAVPVGSSPLTNPLSYAGLF